MKKINIINKTIIFIINDAKLGLNTCEKFQKEILYYAIKQNKKSPNEL